jgi:hypothetical protein
VDVDIGAAVKPTGSFAPFSPVRPDPPATRQAVLTELPPSQSVGASAEIAAARNDAARAPSEPSVAHDSAIDPATREAIYRAVNARSGGTVSEVPDWVQGQLAYTRGVRRPGEPGKQRAKAEGDVDRQA